ncbi:MAG: TIGR03618 family F420-dependent PPOX class oxidoreductase [Myxococcota bacterium]|nr:TIGR03618 family F420-dependent PPOX class oxidoreductase [Myxococcota bacterium]
MLTEEQRKFLGDHKQCVLATGRRDGSPQVSTVAYDFDGNDIVISAKSYTAKWLNALRQPHVALVVNDGHKQLVLYGSAETIEEDPLRVELTRRVFRRLTGNEPPPEERLLPMLDEQRRTILRITPDRVFMND